MERLTDESERDISTENDGLDYEICFERNKISLRCREARNQRGEPRLSRGWTKRYLEDDKSHKTQVPMGKSEGRYRWLCAKIRSLPIKKQVRKKTRLPMIIITTPTTALNTVAMVVVGPKKITEDGYEYTLTMQCLLTKFALAAPCNVKSTISVNKTNNRT